MKIYCYDDHYNLVIKFLLEMGDDVHHLYNLLTQGYNLREEVCEMLFNEGLRKESARVSSVWVVV